MCLAVLCVILVLISFKFSEQLSSVKTVVGNVMTPMQRGINTVGQFISNKLDLMSTKQSLLDENTELKRKLDEMSYDNKILVGENSELENYRKLFKLKKKYPDH